MIDKVDIIGNFADQNVASIVSNFQETQSEDDDSEEQEPAIDHLYEGGLLSYEYVIVF